MASVEFRVSSVIPASPNRIFGAWMDERQHSAIAGTRIRIDPWIGGRVHGWDGEIFASHLRLETGRRIALAFRTREFASDAPDSYVDITLEPAMGGTLVTVVQKAVPPELKKSLETHWKKSYLESMQRFFGSPDGMREALQQASRSGLLEVSSLSAERQGPGRAPDQVFKSSPGTLPAADLGADLDSKKAKSSKGLKSKTKLESKLSPRVSRERRAARVAARKIEGAEARRARPETRSIPGTIPEAPPPAHEPAKTKPAKVSTTPVKATPAKSAAAKKTLGVAEKQAAKKSVPKKTPPAEKAATKKTSAKAKPAKKTAASKTAKPAAAKKAAKATKKTTAPKPAEKAATKKTPASKAAKPAAKKTAPKKAAKAAKKAATKKTSAKAKPAKKTAASKAAKPAAKKTAPKKKSKR